MAIPASSLLFASPDSTGANSVCYCNHCELETCKLESNGLCFAQYILESGKIVKKLGCFEGSLPFSNLICQEESKESVRVCCKGYYCNTAKNLLPTIEEAKKWFSKSLTNDENTTAQHLANDHLTSIGDDHPLAETHLEATNVSPPNSSSVSSSSSLSLSTNSSLSRYISSTPNQQLDDPQQIQNRTSNFDNSLANMIPVPNATSIQPLITKDLRIDHPVDDNKYSIALFILTSLFILFSIALIRVYFNKRTRSSAIIRKNTSKKITNLDNQMSPASIVSQTELFLPEAPPQMSSLPSPSLLTAQDQSLDDLDHGYEATLFNPDAESQSSGRDCFHNAPLDGGVIINGYSSRSSYLSKRSISYDIELLQLIGKGKFGAVYLGKYKSSMVAVKIFSLEAERDWEREVSIYLTALLRHKNILGFIGADKQTETRYPGYWLVTDFYPLGSLSCFLRSNSLMVVDSIRMAFSVANGLVHLHAEIFGLHGKPAIAHRDIKSLNILVRNDGTCVISDLGLAVRCAGSDFIDRSSHYRVGTKRYLAPELLDESIDLGDIEALKATDVYAFGLVLWEMLRRTVTSPPKFPPNSKFDTSLGNAQHCEMVNRENQKVNVIVFDPNAQATCEGEQGSVKSLVSHNLISSEIPPVICPYGSSSNLLLQNSGDECQTNDGDAATWFDDITNRDHPHNLVCDTYEVPYQGFVQRDPTVEDLRDVVCEQKLRPPISFRWTEDRAMIDFTLLMQECWYEKPQARLSALKIRKNLGEIALRHFNVIIDLD